MRSPDDDEIWPTIHGSWWEDRLPEWLTWAGWLMMDTAATVIATRWVYFDFPNPTARLMIGTGFLLLVLRSIAGRKP
jgi:hypothetical protein